SSIPSLAEHSGSHRYSGSKRSSLRSQNFNQSPYSSPVLNSPPNTSNITLVLESSNDAFQTKKIDLTEGVSVKIGRTTNKNTAPTETNGYFDSKVLSRTHAEVWTENGKVYIKDLRSSNGTFVNGRRISAESKESEAVELNNYDILEFGIDINNEDRKLMFSKVTARVHISSSNFDTSNGHSFKGESIHKRIFDPESSIYATLESELHWARDESRRLVELNNIIGDMSKYVENKSNKLYSDENLALFRKIEETQAKINEHLEKCEIEKNARQQKHQSNVKNVQENSKLTMSNDTEEAFGVDHQIKELSSKLAHTEEQLTEEHMARSNNEEGLRRQVTEMASQLEFTRGELENMKHVHETKIQELNQQTYNMINQLNNAHEELGKIRALYGADAENFKHTQENYEKARSISVNPLDSNQNFNFGEIQHANIFAELLELKTKYEKMFTDQESLVNRINTEHASLIANKDNQIGVLQEERLDFANQFAQFRKETLNALDTVKKQLSAAQETISLITNENECLNSRLEKALTENERIKIENIEIKTEFELWRKEKQEEIETYENLDNVDGPSVKGSNNIRFRPLNQHKKQESTVKDSEWTDNEWGVENNIKDITIASNEKADEKEYKKFIGTIGVVLVGFGGYLIAKFCN
ncbi:14636_t:CDS:2, partial [Acaulospora morrowiae]